MMVERTPNRPIPEEDLKQNAPGPGAGPLGIPPPDPEQPLQSEVKKSTKLNPSGQSEEAAPAQRGSESTFEQPAKLSKVDAAKAIGVSLGTLYRYINWGSISVEPEGTIDTAEALRFASARAQQAKQRPTLEERVQREREEKKRESNRRWRERWKQLKEQGDSRVLALTEANLARRRQRYHERKEQRKLQAEQQQPTQVFPDHPNK
jgi:hypothetical protein